MITANFFHIKAENGLYYYGIDYLNENINLVRKILVRSSLEAQIKSKLPYSEVVACTMIGYIVEVLKTCCRRDLLYTPTPHPLPFVNNQVIVFHDAYPFRAGKVSAFKRFLLRLSLSLSCCKVGYINKSDARPFVLSLGVSSKRMIFAPNKFPNIKQGIYKVVSPVNRMVVGLFGTDSSKKNYDRLLNAVKKLNGRPYIVFRVYGQDSKYFRDICAMFSEFEILLSNSDIESPIEFLNQVDIVLSVAQEEGFGRPIALALLAGLRVELLDCLVFREFFNGGAHFHPNIDALVQSLVKPLKTLENTCYVAPVHIVSAFIEANKKIRLLGSSNSK
jgi:glycosyltransferase involved in cell wall biosynthesis